MTNGPFQKFWNQGVKKWNVCVLFESIIIWWPSFSSLKNFLQFCFIFSRCGAISQCLHPPYNYCNKVFISENCLSLRCHYSMTIITADTVFCFGRSTRPSATILCKFFKCMHLLFNVGLCYVTPSFLKCPCDVRYIFIIFFSVC